MTSDTVPGMPVDAANWGEGYAYKTGKENGYAAGYAAALRDAVTAIQADFEFDELGDQRHAVDIIEALGGSA